MARPEQKTIIRNPSPDSQPNCTLSVLPAEVRTVIFEYVLSVIGLEGPSSSGGIAYIDRLAAFIRRYQSPHFFAILSTCRAIYYEAVGIFYSQHTIRFANCDIGVEMPKLVANLSIERLASIEKFEVSIDKVGDVLCTAKCALEMSRLQSLRFMLGRNIQTRSPMWKEEEWRVRSRIEAQARSRVMWQMVEQLDEIAPIVKLHKNLKQLDIACIGTEYDVDRSQKAVQRMKELEDALNGVLRDAVSKSTSSAELVVVRNRAE